MLLTAGLAERRDGRLVGPRGQVRRYPRPAAGGRGLDLVPAFASPTGLLPPLPRVGRDRRVSQPNRVVLDGELVHLDPDGRPDFATLRPRLSRHGDAPLRASRERPTKLWLRHPGTWTAAPCAHCPTRATRPPHGTRPRRTPVTDRAELDQAARRRGRRHTRAR